MPGSLFKKPEDYTTEEKLESPKTQVVLDSETLKGIVAAAVKAAREPDEDTKRKLAEEKERMEARRQSMLAVAKAEEKQREDAWRNCNHTKPNGRPSVGGQVHSDGLYHPFCLRCQFPFPARKPQDANVVGALNA